MRYILLIFSIAVVISSYYLLVYDKPEQRHPLNTYITDILSENNKINLFQRALKPRRFIFPKDSGPHPTYQTEWWYYTGNLTDKNGRHFGYQLTFFRRAISPVVKKSPSSWATNQIYFAHFAISDTRQKRFYPAERWSREALGLAGAQSYPHRVWIEDWSATEYEDGFRLIAGDDLASIDLKLNPAKQIVFHGNNGLSYKSSEKGNASYYYSQTRLHTSGKINIETQIYEVTGLSWLDREWGTSALSKKQSGWDWFSLQLNDGRDIMLYQLRLKDGGIDPYSSGSLIEADGTLRQIKSDDFKIEILDKWKSPKTGIVYPSLWAISIPKYKLKMRVIPHQLNQELPLTFIYWEGAVKVKGTNVSGNGYVELTGYKNK